MSKYIGNELFLNPFTVEKYVMCDNLRIVNLIPTSNPYVTVEECNLEMFAVTDENTFVDYFL